MLNENNHNIINNLPQIYWACRRGMLELDVLLGNFLKKPYLALSDDDKKQFVALLEYSDPELFDWLLGHSLPADPGLARIIEAIRHYAQS